MKICFAFKKHAMFSENIIIHSKSEHYWQTESKGIYTSVQSIISMVKDIYTHILFYSLDSTEKIQTKVP